MRKVRQDLAEMPKSFAENPQSDLMSLCHAFIKEVESYTSGKPNDDPDQATFLGDASPHYEALKQEVIRTRPQFGISPANFPMSCGRGEVFPDPIVGPLSPPLARPSLLSEKELHGNAPNHRNWANSRVLSLMF